MGRALDGAEVFDAGGEHGKLVLDGGGGNARIAHLQTVGSDPVARRRDQNACRGAGVFRQNRT
jgi:hypothetical protein